jgi:hypothetical protein
MGIFDLAGPAIDMVNPDETVQIQRSTGFTIGAGRKQVPSYAAAISGPAQIQALDNSDLRQIEGLNIQGEIRAIYLRGSLAGVVRPDSKGGDLVLRGANFSEVWLVVKVLETWPEWTKAVITRQLD